MEVRKVDKTTRGVMEDLFTPPHPEDVHATHMGVYARLALQGLLLRGSWREKKNLWWLEGVREENVYQGDGWYAVFLSGESFRLVKESMIRDSLLKGAKPILTRFTLVYTHHVLTERGAYARGIATLPRVFVEHPLRAFRIPHDWVGSMRTATPVTFYTPHVKVRFDLQTDPRSGVLVENGVLSFPVIRKVMVLDQHGQVPGGSSVFEAYASHREVIYEAKDARVLAVYPPFPEQGMGSMHESVLSLTLQLKRGADLAERVNAFLKGVEEAIGKRVTLEALL